MEKVWDNVVLSTNWLMAISLIVGFLTLPAASEIGGLSATIHMIALSVLFMASCLRLVWGLIGTPPARFSSFLQHPAKLFVQLYSFTSTKEITFTGHSPLGGFVAFIVLMLMSAASVLGLFFVAPDGVATPLAILSGLYFTNEAIIMHTTMINLAFYAWLAYAVGVFVTSFLRGNEITSLIFNGEEKARLDDETKARMDEPKYFTSGFVNYALALALFAVLVVPTTTNLSDYIEFDNYTGLNIANVEPGEKRTPFLAQTPVDMATELSQIRTAAGLDSLEPAAGALNNLDITGYGSQPIPMPKSAAETIGYSNVRDLQDIETEAGEEERDLILEEGPTSSFTIPIQTQEDSQ